MSRLRFTNGRNDWIRFDLAFENLPLCCPSRASILTGRYSHRLGIEDNNSGQKLDESATVAVALKRAGYHTGLFGKYLNRYPFGRGLYVPPGWDDWASFRVDFSYFDYQLVENGPVVGRYGHGTEDYSTDVLTKRATAFIETPRKEPFFLWLGFNAPHITDLKTPATPAPRHLHSPISLGTRPSFNEADVHDKPAWIRKLPLVSRKKMDDWRRQEERSLLAVDDGVRGVFDALTRRGILDRTVVIYMSDNGFSWGEHRVFGKGCPYEDCIHMPLLVRYPGVPGRHVHQLVSNIDIAPTLAAIGGARLTQPVDGVSILPFLRGEAPATWRSAVLIRGIKPDQDDYYGVRTIDHLYVEYATGERELYDLRRDPFELNNLAGTRPTPLEDRLSKVLTSLRGP